MFPFLSFFPRKYKQCCDEYPWIFVQLPSPTFSKNWGKASEIVRGLSKIKKPSYQQTCKCKPSFETPFQSHKPASLCSSCERPFLLPVLSNFTASSSSFAFSQIQTLFSEGLTVRGFLCCFSLGFTQKNLDKLWLMGLSWAIRGNWSVWGQL